MFNWFKRIKNQKRKAFYSPSFRNLFTTEQKGAIIGTLISFQHGHINEETESIVEQISGMLDIDFNDPIIQNVANEGMENGVKIIRGIDEYQRKWLCFTFKNLTGNFSDYEERVNAFIKILGISSESYKDEINKFENVLNSLLNGNK